jgi:thioredoxin 1
MSDKIIALTDENFEQVISKSKTVLVDFWAPWCGPCKALTPVLDEISNEYADKITIAKLNIDEGGQSAQKYGIRGVPTLLLFVDGTVSATKMGALTKAELSAFIDTNL